MLNEVCYNEIGKVNLENRITNICELPLTLSVADISKVLGISKHNAYCLCHNKGFPCIQVGKRLVIPRPAFERWMENPFIFESEEKLDG
jgi:excisionase family DNA binding protein